jgi:hypothetical protein
MTQPDTNPPKCPRCRNTAAKLCGQSVQYGPAEWPDQPLQAREILSLAYQCDCGLAFTQTAWGDVPPKA